MSYQHDYSMSPSYPSVNTMNGAGFYKFNFAFFPSVLHPFVNL